MELKEAKEIIEAGVAWANWTEEQKEAMKVAWNAMNKVERYVEMKNEIQTVLHSPLTDFVELHEAIQDNLNKY
jgi:transcription termination factor Rho